MPAARPSPRCIALPPEWLRGRDVDVSDAGRFFHDVWSRLRFDPLPPSDIEVVRLLPILPGLGQGSGLGRYGRSAKVPRRRRSCRQEREYKDWEHPRQDCRRCGVLQVLLVDRRHGEILNPRCEVLNVVLRPDAVDHLRYLPVVSPVL